MKKIISLVVLLIGLTITDMAYAAPDKVTQNINTTVDDLFVFDDDDFDPTTAFVNIEEDYVTAHAIGLGGSLDMSSLDVDVTALIAYAKQYLGRPYVWGAKGPKSFDCSGFTSYVFRKFNISLSPAANMQVNQGAQVARKDIRPGDLLFFQGRRTKGVGHVALAIDVDATGDVTFIHAASRGVCIDKLSTVDYYKSRYICARRVIK